MARKTTQEAAKAKAAKQKKILIGGSVLLVALLAIQGPKTMKMLSGSRNAPTVDASVQTATTAATQTTPTPISTPSGSSVAAPTLAAPAAAPTTSSGSQLVSSVEPTADPGQLEQFYRFASKDPFAVQATANAASSASGSSPAKKKTSTSKTATSSGGTKSGSGSGAGSGSGTAPPDDSGSGSGSQGSTGTSAAAPAPTAAVISLDGVLMSVNLGGAFPSSSPLFQLQSLTATTAKISIVGGSYADGSAALTLTVGKTVTLENTADGTRYTLLLEPQGTQAPAAGGSTPPATTTPTTPVTPVVPTTPTAPPTTTTTTSFGG